MSAVLAMPVETDAYRTLYSGTDRKQFLHSRKGGIGASDIAAVLGFSKWRTPYQVWEDKTGRAAPRPQTQAMEFGLALESVVARRFQVRHGHPRGSKRQLGRPIGRVRPAPGVLQSKAFPWLLASTDRLIEEFEQQEFLPPLEIKTAGAFVAAEWSGGEVPDYYQAQNQSQQLVQFGPELLVDDAPKRWGWIVPLIGGNEMPEPTRLYFDHGFAKYLIEYAGTWWIDYVEKDVPPPLTLADDLNAIAPPVEGRVIVATPEIEKLVAERNVLQPKMAADARRDKEIKDQIKLFMLDAVELRQGSETGTVLVGYGMPKTKPGVEAKLDLDRLEAEHPEIVEQYVTLQQKSQSRTMSFRKVTA